jgi:hypothetical protein
VIELADFNLRGGSDAPFAAARAVRVSERYLSPGATRDVTAVVTEVVSRLGDAEPAPLALRLELSVTSSVVRVAVTSGRRTGTIDVDSNDGLRRSLPVTAALASRYGVEAKHRMRVWAEFDRVPVFAHAPGKYSW